MEYKKNEDGTDFLDENGNKVPIETTDDKEKEIAKATALLVEEIKELRLKNGLMKDILDGKTEEPPKPKEPVTPEDKLKALVDEKFKEEKALSAKSNKETAFKKFVTENKEFHPDNDPTGLRRDALQRKVNQFNTEGLQTVEEFLAVIGDAKKLLLGNDIPVETSKGKNLDSFPTPKGDPSGKEDEELSPKEIKLIKMTGKSKEQILKLKKTNPEFLEGLLEHVRG